MGAVYRNDTIQATELQAIREKFATKIDDKYKDFIYKSKDWWLVTGWLPSEEKDGDFAKEIQLNNFTHEEFKKCIGKFKKEWEELLDAANKVLSK